MVFSSDNQYTIRLASTPDSRPREGSFTIPVVGGPSSLAAATGTGYQEVRSAARCRRRYR
jgi:hypothetical protein